ncbi:MAG: heavy-metal-associated domain-containing protein [Chloroflexaceae bacterium]|nr:heavy-metal-associated domain-containing protein [Chloroflexaceae bacterium]
MTETATHNVQVVHLLPGRIRIKADHVKGNRALADAMQRNLKAIQGIHRVNVNPVTGSVLIIYDPALLTGSWDSLLEVAGAVGLLSSNNRLSREQVEHWLHVLRSGEISQAPATVADNIQTLFGSLNTRVTRATGNSGDLKDLVPLALFFLGVRSLLFSKASHCPKLV